MADAICRLSDDQSTSLPLRVVELTSLTIHGRSSFVKQCRELTIDLVCAMSYCNSLRHTVSGGCNSQNMLYGIEHGLLLSILYFVVIFILYWPALMAERSNA